MEHLRVPLAEESNLCLADPDAMRETGVGPEYPEFFEEFDVVDAAALAHRFHLPPVLRGMRVEEHAGKGCSHRVCFREEPIGTGEDEPRGNGIFHSSGPFAVPLFGLFERRTEGVVRRFAECRIDIVAVHHGLSNERTEACFLHSRRDLLFALDAPHIHDRGRSGPDQLGDAGHRGGAHRGRVVGRFERVDFQAEPVEELKVVGQTAEERLAQMDMRLDEAGDRRERGSVEHSPFEGGHGGEILRCQDRFDRGTRDDEGTSLEDAP